MPRIPTAVPQQPQIRQPGRGDPGAEFRTPAVDASAIGRSIAAIGEGLGAIGVAHQRSADRAEDFETKRRFLEFQTQQTQQLRDLQRDAQPGAFGFTQKAADNYGEAARKFFASVPQRLKGEYDLRLADTESKLVLDSDAFEQRARTDYYTNSINGGLEGLRNRLVDGEDGYEDALAQGIELIAAADLPPIEKQKFLDSWTKDATAAAWRREYQLDPEAALAAAGGGTPAQRISYQRNKLVGAVIQAESGGNPRAESSAGAAGIMQVIPGTARDIARELKDPNFPKDATDAEVKEWLKDPANGKRYGEFYLDKMLRMFNGDVEAALIGYNAGPGNARKWLKAGRDYSALPKRSETEPYVQKIMGNIGAPVTIKGEEPYKFQENGPADPRLDVLDVEDRLRLISDAQKRISDLTTERRREQVDSFNLRMEQDPTSVSEEEILSNPSLDDGDKATLLSRRESQLGTVATERSGQIELQLAQDPSAVTEKSIIDDPLLSDRQKATLVNKRTTALKEYNERQNAVGAYAQGIQGNALSTDDRKSVDEAWKTFNIQPDNEQYSVSALSVVQRRGILPGPVLEGVRGSILQGDLENAVASLDLASAANDLNQQALAGRDGSADVRNAVAEYNHFLKLGFSKEEAAAKVVAARQPGAEQANIPKDVQKKIERISTGDIENLYDESFTDLFTADPTLGPAVSQQTMLGEYRDILEEHYRETGDLETARARADEQMKRTYNVSNATGKPVIMRYPPEQYYPPFNGTQDYIAEQLSENAREAYGEDIQGVDLVAVPGVTDVDVHMGRQPRYGAIIQREDGTYDVLPEGVYWQPDVPKAEEQAQVDRAQEIRDRIRGIEETALDNEGLVQPGGGLLIRVRNYEGNKLQPGSSIVDPATREIYRRSSETGKFEPTGDMYGGILLIQKDGRTFDFSRTPAAAAGRQIVRDRDAQALQNAREAIRSEAEFTGATDLFLEGRGR